MAASPSAAQIARAYASGLYKLRRDLLRRGIESRYDKPTRRLVIIHANVEYAEYKLLRASNGECALYPRINYRTEVNGLKRSGRTEYEGWDAFDKIESLNSMANVRKEMS